MNPKTNNATPTTAAQSTAPSSLRLKFGILSVSVDAQLNFIGLVLNWRIDGVYMPRGKSADIELAALGASVKIAELEAQIADLKKRFPGAAGSANQATPVRTRKRKRRTVSAAERKLISARMKKRWADWRNAKGAKG